MIGYCSILFQWCTVHRSIGGCVIHIQACWGSKRYAENFRMASFIGRKCSRVEDRHEASVSSGISVAF